MDYQIYIYYILILKNFMIGLCKTNHYPIEIIRLIIMSIYEEIKISSGYSADHLFVYTPQGAMDLYAWGNNETGQLGIGYSTKKNYMKGYTLSGCLQKINFNFSAPIKSVVCGKKYSICLTEAGYVYSWGNNSVGQLGLGDMIDKHSPQKIELSNVVIINCGSNYTIAYENGNFYGWDESYHGEFGFSYVGNWNKPTLLSWFYKNVLQISCGESHILCLTTDCIIGWGNNSRGQLGSAIDLYDGLEKYNPIEITFFKENKIEIISIKCGKHQTMFLSAVDEIYVCGDDGCTQSDETDYNEVYGIKKLYVKFNNIKEIDCGGHNKVVLTKDGKSYLNYVRFIYGNLQDLPVKKDRGIDYFTNFEEHIPGIQMVKCGKNHVVYVTHIYDDKCVLTNKILVRRNDFTGRVELEF